MPKIIVTVTDKGETEIRYFDSAVFLYTALSAPSEDHSSYIDNWPKVLKEDKLAIFSAGAHAQRAADYLHTTQGRRAWHDKTLIYTLISTMICYKIWK